MFLVLHSDEGHMTSTTAATTDAVPRVRPTSGYHPPEDEWTRRRIHAAAGALLPLSMRRRAGLAWQREMYEVEGAYRPQMTGPYQSDTEARIRRAHTGDSMHWSAYGDVHRTI